MQQLAGEHDRSGVIPPDHWRSRATILDILAELVQSLFECRVVAFDTFVLARGIFVETCWGKSLELLRNVRVADGFDECAVLVFEVFLTDWDVIQSDFHTLPERMDQILDHRNASVIRQCRAIELSKLYPAGYSSFLERVKD